MKLVVLMSLFVFASCGKVEVAGSALIGSKKAIVPEQLNNTSVTRIRSICDALAAKESALNNNPNADYVFSGSTKGCNDNGFAPLPNTTVRLVDQKFLEGALPYYFSDVETPSSGVLSQICNSLSLGVSPIATSPNEFIYFTVNDTAECQSGGTNQCILIERATRTSETQAKVHTQEWIRVNTVSPNINNVGFWTFKKRLSQASCAEGYHSGRSATLVP